MFSTIFIICISYLSYGLAVICPEPAMKPTIFIGTTSYQHGAQFKVQEGAEFLARCEQNGAKKLNITCGSSGNIFNSNYDYYDSVVYLPSVYVNKTMTGMQCTCNALQQSGCYTESIITLNVTYPPEITMLTANNKNSSVEVNLNDPLHFICTANGNPMPVLYLTHETPTSSPFVTVQTYVLDHTKQAQCTDTDLYYCVSNNNINTGTLASKQKSIQVYVKCATQVVPGTGNSFSVKLGSTAEVRISITAYPNPNTFALYTQLDNFYKPVEPSKHNITFIPDTAPKGTIVVYIYRTTRDDLKDYRLDIENGVSGASPYDFRLTEKKDDLTVGAIVGIAVGVFAGVVLLIIVIAVIVCNKKKPKSHIHKNKPEEVYDSATYNYNSPYVIGYERPKLAPPCEYVDVEEQYDTIPADVVNVDEVYIGETLKDTAEYMHPLPDPEPHTFTYGGSVYSQTTDAGVLPGARPHSSAYNGSVYSQATDVTNLPGDSNNSFSHILQY